MGLHWDDREPCPFSKEEGEAFCTYVDCDMSRCHPNRQSAHFVQTNSSQSVHFAGVYKVNAYFMQTLHTYFVQNAHFEQTNST